LAGRIAGAVVVLVRDWRRSPWTLLAFAPTPCFSAVSGNDFVRYAPANDPAGRVLAVRGLFGDRARCADPRRAIVPITGGRRASGIAYGREPHPEFRAIATPPGATRATRRCRLLALLPSACRAGRPRDAAGNRAAAAVRMAGLVDYWKAAAPVRCISWRTPVVRSGLIDPQSRRDVVRYRWSVGERPELSGTRPTGVDWYRLSAAGWLPGRDGR